MRLVRVTEGDKDRYNNFLEKHPRGHPLQTWNWGEVKAQTGWAPYRLAVEDNNEFIGVASLLERTIPVVNRSILYCPRGPVLNWQDRDTATFLMGGIRKLAEDSGVVFLKIDPDLGAEEEKEVELLGELGFLEQDTGADFGGVQPKYVMRLDLRGRDKDELLADFHSKTRYNIRYAYRKGIDVNTSCEREQLDAFYELLQITAERDEFGIRSYDYFVYIWEHIIRPGLGKLVVAEHDGQPLAGAIAFRNGPRVWYVYGASSNEKRNLMPTYAVQWELICWAKELGCHTYDFRGVSGDLDPDNPLYGLYRFKKGFDAKMFELAGEFDLVYSTPWYWFWNTMEPLYRRFRSTFSDWLN